MVRTTYIPSRPFIEYRIRSQKQASLVKRRLSGLAGNHATSPFQKVEKLKHSRGYGMYLNSSSTYIVQLYLCTNCTYRYWLTVLVCTTHLGNVVFNFIRPLACPWSIKAWWRHFQRQHVTTLFLKKWYHDLGHYEWYKQKAVASANKLKKWRPLFRRLFCAHWMLKLKLVCFRFCSRSSLPKQD